MCRHRLERPGYRLRQQDCSRSASSKNRVGRSSPKLGRTAGGFRPKGRKLKWLDAASYGIAVFERSWRLSGTHCSTSEILNFQRRPTRLVRIFYPTIKSCRGDTKVFNTLPPPTTSARIALLSSRRTELA